MAPHLESPPVLYGLIFVITAAVVPFGGNALYILPVAVLIVLIVFARDILRPREAQDNTSSSEAIIDAAADLVEIAEELEAVDHRARVKVLRRARDLYYFVGREDLAADIRQLIDELRPPEPV